ncbi:alkaline phosphatase PhoX [Trujillonella endophytica]|uniref:WD40-like Beta Propeller Repeat n=1 Tax=Trujillonella endophytica TaxID=673521 RepID=A0A1H8SE03_9ACTN|nr:alkaline phosphatase PhoX [Trujillella endophytica]SEO76785.1 hypothetical protein SAMN05660991_01626 [Trujillella endophytica]
MTMNRRSFLTSGSALAVATAFGSTLLGATAGPASAAPPAPGGGRPGAGYGPLRPTAPRGGGPEYLAVPAGFTYSVHGITGAPMSGYDHPHPHQLDGAAAFELANGNVAYLRNCEDRAPAGAPQQFSIRDRTNAYDARAYGGVTTLEFDRNLNHVVRESIVLTGTTVNCAGGIVSVDGVQGWMTCEETTVGPANGFEQKHGYTYFVPAAAEGPVRAEPFRQMGRFAHEAVAQDAAGVVYLTEDQGDTSGFYRYLPDDRSLRTGRLQMLAVDGQPTFTAFTGQQQGATFPVTWVDIAIPDPELPAQPRTAVQGRTLGAAYFNRLEGIWAGAGTMTFASTSGGAARRGQIWQYDIARQTLSMIFESTGSDVLDSPDNLVVTPRGGIILCEDDASGDGDTHPLAPGLTDVNRLIGLSADAQPFELVVNRFNDAELAGAAFSPDGRTLFFNVFGNGAAGQGFTVALRGPWNAGPL